MFIELPDFLLYLNRLGLLMVCLAVWVVVPHLLPEDKQARWRVITDTAFGKLLELFFAMLFVCVVFFYTILLFLLSANLLQSIAIFLAIPGRLNFMVILLALPLAGIIQVFSMRYLRQGGFSFQSVSEQPPERSVHSVRMGTLLLATGFLFQFLATFG